MPSGRNKFALLVCAFALVLGGCGEEPESLAIDYEAALADAPPKLEALYAQGDALIPGGREAFEDQLAELRGHPVVANIWASWCVPCREEFPEFQQAAADFGERVAFIGVDTEDGDDAARTFLDRFPLPYPSVTDPEKEVQTEIGLVGLPGTAFYDRSGKLVYLKQGPYESQDELTADLERYVD
jgi:cytochrome c biogenesis protein CcmG, thiol:disulfide interchange protein DsbE